MCSCDWSSDVCSSDLLEALPEFFAKCFLCLWRQIIAKISFGKDVWPRFPLTFLLSGARKDSQRISAFIKALCGKGKAPKAKKSGPNDKGNPLSAKEIQKRFPKRLAPEKISFRRKEFKSAFTPLLKSASGQNIPKVRAKEIFSKSAKISKKIYQQIKGNLAALF